jgi:hypothetical protein
MVKEFINHEAGNHEGWICLCGNTPVGAGFYPCDIHGNEMVPTLESGWDDLYVCANCGRIIRQQSLEIVGINPELKLL